MGSISNIRFSGMASGLDTDQIIKDLMKVERFPLDRLQQNKQTLMWRRDAYREVNLMYSSFRSLTDSLRLESTFDKQKAVSNNTGVVTAQAGAGAVTGSYSIKVNQLASGATIVGSALGSGIDLKATGLKEGNFTITGPNKNPDGTSLKVTINVTSASTRQSVIDDINSSGTGITASFDSTNGRLILSTKQTGEDASISIDDPSNVFALNLGIATTAGPVKGKDANVELNGATMTMSTNSFTFNNITFSLKGTTSSASTVDVSQDTDGIISKITDFVNKYNEIIDTVHGKITEKKDRNYTPLTDEQKEAMTEKQIDLWESKAKVGLLSGDDMLESTLLSLRQAFMGKVDGLPKGQNTLASIGIATSNSKDAYKENGKLHIDVDKLKDALLNNPEGVKALFTQTSEKPTTDPARKGELGFAERVKETLDSSISLMIRKIGSGTLSEILDSSIMGRQLRELNDKIYNMEDKLQTTEDRYYKKFTAMEKALQDLNNRGSWLSQQLGQG